MLLRILSWKASLCSILHAIDIMLDRVYTCTLTSNDSIYLCSLYKTVYHTFDVVLMSIEYITLNIPLAGCNIAEMPRYIRMKGSGLVGTSKTSCVGRVTEMLDV